MIDNFDNKEKKLTHIDDSGKANMVEISDKEIVSRTAKARGKILKKAMFYPCRESRE